MKNTKKIYVSLGTHEFDNEDFYYVCPRSEGLESEIELHLSDHIYKRLLSSQHDFMVGQRYISKKVLGLI